MKKRKKLRNALVLWISSVLAMNILLFCSFGTYNALKNELSALKTESLQWEKMLSVTADNFEEHKQRFAVLSIKDNPPVTSDTYEDELNNPDTSLNEDNQNNDNNDIHNSDDSMAKTEGVQAGEDTTIQQSRDISLVFSGDLLLSGAILRQYDNSEGHITGIVCEPVLNEMLEADICMVNQEFPFSNRGTPMPNKQYTFRTPVERIGIMHEMGIDIVSLANNHALDYGIDALLDTCTTLDDAKIKYVGAGDNLDRAKQLEIIEVDGVKFGFLAASRVIPVTNWNATDEKAGMLTTYDPTLLLQEIEAADELCDVLIVYVHWGLEYKEYPEQYQVYMATQYVDAGADVVLGSHPHVVQGFTYYKDKLIAYSLGNFAFGNTIKRGMLLKLTRTVEGEIQANVIPFHSPEFSIIEMEEGQEQEFYTYLTGISDGVTIDENGVLHNTPD